LGLAFGLAIRGWAVEKGVDKWGKGGNLLVGKVVEKFLVFDRQNFGVKRLIFMTNFIQHSAKTRR
jgi:hypothetical protein